MKKPKYIAPRMYVREMVDGPDLDRMLESGSYLVASMPKKPTRHSVAQKEYMQRRFAAGYKSLNVLLPEPVFNQMRAMLQEGETFAELLERLMFSFSDNDSISIAQPDN